MYVEMTQKLEINLMGMSWEEALALKTMIEGSGQREHRMFKGYLKQLNLLL